MIKNPIQILINPIFFLNPINHTLSHPNNYIKYYFNNELKKHKSSVFKTPATETLNFYPRFFKTPATETLNFYPRFFKTPATETLNFYPRFFKTPATETLNLGFS